MAGGVVRDQRAGLLDDRAVARRERRDDLPADARDLPALTVAPLEGGHPEVPDQGLEHRPLVDGVDVAPHLVQPAPVERAPRPFPRPAVGVRAADPVGHDDMGVQVRVPAARAHVVEPRPRPLPGRDPLPHRAPVPALAVIPATRPAGGPLGVREPRRDTHPVRRPHPFRVAVAARDQERGVEHRDTLRRRERQVPHRHRRPLRAVHLPAQLLDPLRVGVRLPLQGLPQPGARVLVDPEPRAQRLPRHRILRALEQRPRLGLGHRLAHELAEHAEAGTDPDSDRLPRAHPVGVAQVVADPISRLPIPGRRELDRLVGLVRARPLGVLPLPRPPASFPARTPLLAQEIVDGAGTGRQRRRIHRHHPNLPRSLNNAQVREQFLSDFRAHRLLARLAFSWGCRRMVGISGRRGCGGRMRHCS